ncbi:MAG TPA: hypothetical protein VIN77_14120 [Aurantimonas sp.]
MKTLPALASTVAAALLLAGPAAAQFAATGDGILGHFYERTETASSDRQDARRHFGYRGPRESVDRVSAPEPAKQPELFPGVADAQGKAAPDRR